MVGLSCGLHVAAFLVAMMADAFHRRPLLTETVAVVDLVGSTMEREEPSPPAQGASPPSPPAAKAPPAAAPSRAAKEAPPAASHGARPSPEGLLPPRPAVAEKAPPPDAASAQEAIRALRERRDQSDRVRDIVARRKMERDAAAAIGGVRDRASRAVDLSSIRPSTRGGAAGPAGAAGNTRATAEQVAYFRALDDRIRANWIAPRGDTSALMVQVVVTIERTGAVSSAVVEKGSGNDFFDDSVQRAIRKASPLPVPPERLRGGEECYSVGFRFYGTGGGEG